jgi:hypothetical protein
MHGYVLVLALVNLLLAVAEPPAPAKISLSPYPQTTGALLLTNRIPVLHRSASNSGVSRC